jgi:hypothetical protein
MIGTANFNRDHQYNFISDHPSLLYLWEPPIHLTLPSGIPIQVRGVSLSLPHKINLIVKVKLIGKFKVKFDRNILIGTDWYRFKG